MVLAATTAALAGSSTTMDCEVVLDYAAYSTAAVATELLLALPSL